MSKNLYSTNTTNSTSIIYFVDQSERLQFHASPTFQNNRICPQKSNNFSPTKIFLLRIIIKIIIIKLLKY